VVVFVNCVLFVVTVFIKGSFSAFNQIFNKSHAHGIPVLYWFFFLFVIRIVVTMSLCMYIWESQFCYCLIHSTRTYSFW